FAGRKAAEIPARPSTIVPGLGPQIEAVILQCLEPDPARRPASALEFLAKLPGGDPLEAAIRAGETPSPEMVAAAGEERSLSPAGAWALFAATLFLGAAAIFVQVRVAGLDQVPVPRSPEVLRERALDIGKALGNDVAPRSVEWWFGLDAGYLGWAVQQRRPPSLTDTRPSVLRFACRQGPLPMIPTVYYVPTRRDPAPFWSGESYVALDPVGNLLEFSRLPRQLAAPDSAPSAPLDWS